MNRNRVSDGGERRGASGQRAHERAGAEVVYVGRASFWTDSHGELFQEMPESPRPGMERAADGAVERADGGSRAGVVVSAAAAVPSGGTSVILGINLSGPIIVQG